MRSESQFISENERAAFRAITAFLSGRLEQRATIAWAVALKPNDTIKRLALLHLIDTSGELELTEPWRTAWRLIEESWKTPLEREHTASGQYEAQRRICAGERSVCLIASIVDLVAPRLKVEAPAEYILEDSRRAKKPKRVEDIVSIRVTSGQVVDPAILELQALRDPSFLVAIANALEASLVYGLDIARLMGWDEERGLWQLGGLNCVYYVTAANHSVGEFEPDEFSHGIAPSTKLLHAVVSRLAEVDVASAVRFIRRWKLTDSPVHARLWAACAQNPQLVSAEEVGSELLSFGERRFWHSGEYPEIAELRAVRFSDLNSAHQLKLIARIQKLPDRKYWLHRMGKDNQKVRLYWAAQELRRIERRGASLPKRVKAWLNSKAVTIPELLQIESADGGFRSGPQAHYVHSNPDNRYDLLSGRERLSALESALSSPNDWRDDSPAKRASDWIGLAGNPLTVLGDLEILPDAGSDFVRVWDRFGRAHTPPSDKDEILLQDALLIESKRVLSLLMRLPEQTLCAAIGGISYWLSTWRKYVVAQPTWDKAWLKLWPVAVAATNATQQSTEETDRSALVPSSEDADLRDPDTLNNPVGRLVGVFLAGCPAVKPGDTPFSPDSSHTQMRDAVAASIGSAGVIVKCHLIQGFRYFLKADPEWTKSNLVPPLIEETPEVYTLWRAFARSTRFFDELQVIGWAMVGRATDRRLGREAQNSLVFSLVLECLHSFREKRDPAVPYSHISQMLRSLDEEIRAIGARVIPRFVRELSNPREDGQTPPSPEELFRSAAAPFLQEVWPQERSLTTPGISRALAYLPAAAREAFHDAVEAIDRFLVPFECWSLHEYGLSGDEGGSPKLSIINDNDKAAAFLRLLDLTLGGTIHPLGLADGLDQVRKVAPNLVKTPVFRRLATIARKAY